MSRGSRRLPTLRISQLQYSWLGLPLLAGSGGT